MHALICLPQRVHFSIQVGEMANDYQEIAAKDKLSELQLRVRQLLDQVDQISKEQTYQRVSLLTHSRCNLSNDILLLWQQFEHLLVIYV